MAAVVDTSAHELTARAQLAVLARILYDEGYNDHYLGHITYRAEGDTFWTLPAHLGWDEVRASDVIRIDLGGDVVEGVGAVPPAIELHLALHRTRRDVGVAVHQHPEYATIWAAARRIPPAYDQFGSFFTEDEIVLYDDYEGDVIDPATAQKNVDALGDRNVALLANHGVFVVGGDVRQAHFRASCLEWRCKQAWRVEAIGGGTPVPVRGQERLIRFMREVRQERPPILWEWAVRRIVRRDPDVLT